jgi:integrase/recombinase XerD
MPPKSGRRKGRVVRPVPVPDPRPLAAWVEGFLLAKRAEGCAPGTLNDYAAGLKHLRRWLLAQGGGEGEADPRELGRGDLVRFLAELADVPAGRPLAPKTRRNVWVALKSFYRWLEGETGHPSPMAGVPAPRGEERPVRPLTQGEVQALLLACDRMAPARTARRRPFQMARATAVRDKAILLVLLDTGLRAAELCALTVGDVDLKSGEVRVRRGKGGRGRLAYLGAAARRAVWRSLLERGRPTGEAPLFCGRDGRFPLTPDALLRLLKRLGERAGVADVHPHRFRHTFATEFLRNGGDVLTLQRLLGHRSLTMVQRYAEIVAADLQRAHAKASPADAWRL